MFKFVRAAAEKTKFTRSVLQSVFQKHAVSRAASTTHSFGEQGIEHVVVTASENETVADISNQVRALMRGHPDHILVFTDTTKLLAKNHETGKVRTLPLDAIHTEDLTKSRMGIHPGHISLALLDEKGRGLRSETVSLRPNKVLQQASHGSVTGSSLHFQRGVASPAPPTSLSLYHAEHRSSESEVKPYVKKLFLNAQKNIINPAAKIHMTFIPNPECRVPLTLLKARMDTVKLEEIYSLCSGLFEKNKIKGLKAVDKKAIDRLINMSKQHLGFSKNFSGDQSFIAGMACTAAVVKVVMGHFYSVEAQKGPDLAVQVVAVEAVKILIGDKSFAEFANQVGLSEVKSYPDVPKEAFRSEEGFVIHEDEGVDVGVEASAGGGSAGGAVANKKPISKKENHTAEEESSQDGSTKFGP